MSRTWSRRQSDRRRHRRALWADVRWWVVGVLLLGALLLGFLGFRDYQQAVPGEPDGFWDILYRDLQLFVFESGALKEGGQIPLSLEIARLLAPFSLVLFAQQTLAPLLRDQFHILRSSWRRGHTVVCGVGHQGLEVARTLGERGEHVIAIEQAEGQRNVDICRAAGVPVIIGDATDPAVLRRAGVAKAGRLVAVCGEDAVNAQVVTSARKLARGRSAPLRCLAHIVDPHLCSLLQRRQLLPGTDSDVKLEFFNTFQTAARVLLLRHRPFSDQEPPAQPHLVVVGLDAMGAAVVVQAARRWQLRRGVATRRLRITVADADAETKVESLMARHRQLGGACELVPFPFDATSGQFARGDILESSPDGINTAYICLDSDAASLEAALALRRAPGGRDLHIVMQTLRADGLPAFVDDQDGRPIAGLESFPIIERVYDPTLLFGGDEELIARTLHDVYCAERHRAGWRYGPVYSDEAKTMPALAPWAELDDMYRRSNRHQAEHLNEKLARFGRRRERSDSWDQPSSFAEDEVEIMAEMEHDRWMQERRDDGWTSGPKDPARRTTPYLVPWADLADDIREHDREFVRELPIILAELGYHITGREVASP